MGDGPDVQVSAGLLGFEVSTADGQVRAFLSRASCHAGAGPAGAPQSLAQFLCRHRPALDRIVVAKVGAGARSPVVLMARDLVAHAIDAALVPGRAPGRRPMGEADAATQAAPGGIAERAARARPGLEGGADGVLPGVAG